MGVSSGRRRTARVAAGLLALFWGFVWFGLTDLLVVVEQDQSFHEHYLMESGWGLLFLVLVAVPLGVLTAVPGDPAAGAQLVVCTVAVLVGGVWRFAVPQLGVGVGLLASSALVAWLGRWRPPTGQRPRTAAAVLVAVAVVGAVCYAVRLLGERIDERPTNGVGHPGVQVSLGLAVAGVAGLACCTGRLLPAVTAAFAAVWLGVESVVYPTLVGSLGPGLGWVAVAWGLLLVSAVGTSRPDRTRARPRAGRPEPGL